MDEEEESWRAGIALLLSRESDSPDLVPQSGSELLDYPKVVARDESGPSMSAATQWYRFGTGYLVQ